MVVVRWEMRGRALGLEAERCGRAGSSGAEKMGNARTNNSRGQRERNVVVSAWLAQRAHRPETLAAVFSGRGRAGQGVRRRGCITRAAGCHGLPLS